MGYYEFRISVAQEAKEALCYRLFELNCLGLVDASEGVTAYFNDAAGIGTVRKGLFDIERILRQSGLPADFSYTYLFISERDWNESWKKKLQPVDVGKSFSIIPPWEKERPNVINLIVDPGMAFGTGHHETTQTCLELIMKHAGSSSKETFLDIGTGTGILSLAAAKLGFTKVVGVDIDPLAVDAAIRNLKHNKVTNVIILEGTLSDVFTAFDFIVANLLLETLVEAAPRIASHLNKNGTVILSGMLCGQETEVRRSMEDQGLRLVEEVVNGRWASLVFRL